MLVLRSISLKVGKYVAPVFLAQVVLLVSALRLPAKEHTEAGPPGSSFEAADTLMLVREWDADTGMLTGWLPGHSAAIRLQLLDPKRTPHFQPDEAVYLVWPRMPKETQPNKDVRVDPAPRVFEGELWLPVKRDANLVRINKTLYMVRGIILNGGKWRQSAKASTATNTGGAQSLR